MRASILECAKFSDAVYRGPSSHDIPDGYKLFSECPKEYRSHDYYAMSYYREISDDEVEVVIIHRGTKVNYDNLLQDLEIAMGSIPAIFKDSVKPYLKEIYDEVAVNFPSKKISYVQTGHSLGSLLSQLSLADRLKDNNDSYGISFESPGSKELVEQMDLNHDAMDRLKDNIVIYNRDVNAINSYNHQILDEIFQVETKYSYPSSKFFSPVDRGYYYDAYTLAEHGITPIATAFEKDDVKLELKKWPCGLNTGYNYYLSYKNHPEYWEEEFHHYWDQHRSVRYYWFNNYNKFKESMMSELNDQPPKRYETFFKDAKANDFASMKSAVQRLLTDYHHVERVHLLGEAGSLVASGHWKRHHTSESKQMTILISQIFDLDQLLTYVEAERAKSLKAPDIDVKGSFIRRLSFIIDKLEKFQEENLQMQPAYPA